MNRSGITPTAWSESHNVPIPNLPFLFRNCKALKIKSVAIASVVPYDKNPRHHDVDPLYCDVIVSRWEQFTGKKATRVGDVSQETKPEAKPKRKSKPAAKPTAKASAKAKPKKAKAQCV